ncbi:AMP-binding protein [Caldimonas thermodepolymerans]|uniref:AMP-dependent synthetase/ligase n=1 Tax=Caldimonas thermodepolymerans TaxID=215580 RepID=UPI0014053557|nr:AMP-binding protein [Caldimonas thermodepolymerans]QPC32197.1 AMP-binding protein [Caldimonas thermodepolymerans]UZG48743.1 AMP-binding protein [Caldimonas thermodepolymerans]
MAEVASASAQPVRRVSGSHGTDPRSGRRRTLPQLLLAQAERYGDRPFLRAKRHGIWQSTSWKQVVATVLQLSHALRQRGVREGDVVVMLSENLPELYLLQYATQALGAAVTCLYPDAAPHELDYIVGHSGAHLVVAQDQEQVDKALALTEHAQQVRTIVYLEDRGLWNYDDPRLTPYPSLLAEGARATPEDGRALREHIAQASDESVAVLCYTSGTTGKPKGVILTHRYLTDNAYRVIASFGVPEHTVYLSYISPAWAAEQITGLALGLMAPSIIHFSEKPATVQADLREIGPQFLLFTPRQWEMMASSVAAAMLDAKPWRQRLVDWALKAGARRGSWRARIAEVLALRAIRDNLGLKHARIALSAGSGMSAEVFRRFHAMGVPLRNLYGSTEYGLITAHWGGSFHPATLGRLLQVDPQVGAPLEVEVGADEQLLVRGASGFAGYFRDAAATAAVLRDGAFATGDAIRFDEGGEFIFLDRVKDLRRLAGGRPFPPQFIENQLRASPYIRDAIAIGDASRPHVTVLINIDQAIVGRYAEGRSLAWSTFADLSQLPEVHALLRETLVAINEQLDGHARVRCFATFPKELDADDDELTRSRKLRRDVIEQRYAALIDAMYAGASSCPLDVVVQYRDGTRARVHQEVRITPIEAS